jgi:hypothetical protein
MLWCRKEFIWSGDIIEEADWYLHDPRAMATHPLVPDESAVNAVPNLIVAYLGKDIVRNLQFDRILHPVNTARIAT